MADSQGPLMRALASSSTARRRAAMLQLRAYLSSGRRFSHVELLKLWKALFYCLYMTPKMRNQQTLAREIAELGLVFRPGPQSESSEREEKQKEDGKGEESVGKKRKRDARTAKDEDAIKRRKVDDEDNGDGAAASGFVGFQRAFWETIAREWEGVDKARLDKFLYLVRRMVAVGFDGCKDFADQSADQEEEDGGEDGAEAYTWDVQLLKAYVDVLAETPFTLANQRIPVGLRLHALDVLIDELEKVDPKTSLPLDDVLTPLRALAEKSLTKSVKKRAKEVLEDERIGSWTGEDVDD